MLFSSCDPIQSKSLIKMLFEEKPFLDVKIQQKNVTLDSKHVKIFITNYVKSYLFSF